MLALVAGQDVEPAEGSDGTDGRWRIARQVAPDRVISTVDPDARHAHKTRERRQDGFKAHVVVEPDTGLITDTGLTKATGPANSDATVGIALLLADTTLDRRPSRPASRSRCSADSAYATGDALAALEAAGHPAVIKPWPLRPAVPGGFTLDDFTHDPATRHRDLPERDHPPDHRSRRRRSSERPAAAARYAQRCTTATDGRTLKLGPHHALQRAHRARAADPGAPRRPTAGTGRWSNAPSPGSPAATAASPTAAWSRTTPGCTPASPRSTCADC